MKKVVLVGGGKKSLILDLLNIKSKNEEDFKSQNLGFEFQNQERKKNIVAKAKIIIEKNENAFVD